MPVRLMVELHLRSDAYYCWQADEHVTAELRLRDRLAKR
jgi:hypothetical protein